MSKIVYKIEVFWKKNNNSYSNSSDVTVTDIFNLECDNTLESTSDSFQFVVSNTLKQDGSYKYGGKFHVDDRVLIYVKEDDGNGVNGITSSDLLFDGLIMEIVTELTVDARRIIVKGLNRFEYLLAYTFPANFTGKKVHEIIINLLNTANDGLPVNDEGVKERAIGPLDANGQITTTTWSAIGNATGTKDLNYYKTYTPISEQIEELAGEGTNTEKNYIYYIDTSNQFVFKEKSNTISITLTEGVDFQEIKVVDKVWDVVNAMIIDCGTDAYGKTVLALYYNEVSAAKYGLRWAPAKEAQSGMSEALYSKKLYPDMRSKGVFADNSKFPTSYPYTMPFEERDQNGNLLGTFETVNSDVEFNTSIKKELKWLGIQFAKSVVDRTGTVRPRVDLVVRGVYWADSNGLNKLMQGDRANVVSQTKGWVAESFRVMSVNHRLDRNGWMVDLHLEKDIEEGIV